MRQYFKHYFKKNISFLLFLTLFCVIVYVGPLLTQDYYNWNWEKFLYTTPTVYLTNICIALSLMAVFIPIILFSYKMNKRSVDLYYSLPLSKRKILLVHFLMGLILLYVPYTFTYLLGFAIAAIKIKHISLIYYLYLYLASLIPAFTAYSVTTFIFTRANTVWDGMIAVAGALCLLALGVWVVTENFGSLLSDGVTPNAFYPFSAITTATEEFEEAIFRGALKHPFGITIPPFDSLRDFANCVLIGGSLWVLISVAMTVALFVLEPRSRAENCGQISESPFGCKILLPIYTFLFPAAIFTGEFLYIFIIAFAAYAFAAVYKRRFRIGWKYAVVLLSCLIAGTCFSIFGFWF